MEQMIRLAGIVKESTVDGPGIRMVVYFQGCPHHCPGCHNPETWDEDGGKLMPVGQALELVAQHLTPLHQGITLSGGDPFGQPEALLELVNETRKRFPELTIWCYTGYYYEELQNSPALALLDVLVDGPFEETKRELDLVFRGSSNQRIIDVPGSIRAGRVVEHPKHSQSAS